MGSNNFSGIVSQLSSSTKGIASGIMADPNRMENIIGLVRTAAPFTSNKTLNKINTYLPAFEKISTLIGMYSFLNRAQNYAPIQSLNAKTQTEKISALISNGNIPIAKILAQPIIANNMDKIMSSVAKNIINSGNINDMMSMFTQNIKSNQQTSNSSDNKNSMDLSSLMESFMPLMSSIMSEKSSSEHPENPEVSETQSKDLNVCDENKSEEKNVSNSHKIDEKLSSNVTAHEETHQNTNQNNTPVHIRQRKRKKIQ